MSHEQLLEIQSIDVESGQLRHRRVAMPEIAELESAQIERAKIQEEIDLVAAARVEVGTRQRRFEDEALIVAGKADADDARLYSGDISGMKDLQAMQDEIAGLRKRQGGLEDQALEAMEEAETLAEQIAEVESSQTSVNDRITVLEAEIAATQGEIDRRLDEISLQRETAAGEVDASDLDNYERLRPGFESATVVKFDGHKCVGCPSTMPAMEVDRMKRADADTVLSCSECGRIVLR